MPVCEKRRFVMGFFDNAKETLSSTGKVVADAAVNTTQVTKLKVEIKSKESFIEKQYISIGQKVYEAEKEKEESEYEEVFLIKQTEEEIAALQAEIKAHKD